VLIDTRIDPKLARNAIYARAAWEHVSFPDRGLNRLDVEARGYLGLIGQSVLVIRAMRSDSDQTLPPYFKALFGGSANVRGFRAGSGAGDTLVAGSAELLVPLSSQFRFGKIGVNLFTDVGTVYDKPQRLADQTIRQGVGAGLWFSAAFMRVNVAVAHGIDASTRLHATGGVSF
jgi:hemolysin activation/secretion protein